MPFIAQCTHQKSSSSPAAAASFLGLVATRYSREADRGSGARSAKGRMILPMVLFMVVLQRHSRVMMRMRSVSCTGVLDMVIDIAHRYNQ